MALRFYDPTLGKGLFEGEQDKKWRGLLSALQEELEDLQNSVSSAENVLISLPASRAGLAGDILVSLQEYLEPLINTEGFGGLGSMPSGAVVGFDGSLSDARALDGWAVCDGDSGTTNLLDKYVKWSGTASGDTGGCLTHGHDDHTAQQIVNMIDDHDAHAHNVDFDTEVSEQCEFDVSAGSDYAVRDTQHVHGLDGATASNTVAGSMVHDPVGAGVVEHSIANNEPPYVTLIPIMKL